ncbi:glutamate receptor 3.4-like [Camellia sinensis]|uniref:glutamate receptor 3.4-like n=1 Tax=Camellia sinensis TaxID=4442 RepID=UPI001036E15D|nr:glutamate receptor 3.4-like [Camellia sinensis]
MLFLMLSMNFMCRSCHLRRHPTLSALQFPYFLCTRHSDYFQMYAIANLIKFYGWREVVTIFVNDDYGRNGIFVLGDALAKKHAKISYKIVLTLGASRSDINDLLVRVNMMESRVYVFHVNPDSDLTIFSVAKLLWMLTADYIWIATDWLPFVLDSSESVDCNTMNPL